jgi:hypothetical protein
MLLWSALVVSFAAVAYMIDSLQLWTISLGICTVRWRMRLDLRRGGSASDRETPLITGVNGTLMARRRDC